MWGPTTERSAIGATSVATLTYSDRDGWSDCGQCVLVNYMVPERLVGLRLVISGLLGSRGTAGRFAASVFRVSSETVRALHFGEEHL